MAETDPCTSIASGGSQTWIEIKEAIENEEAEVKE
jgi:hypothetical protein